MGVNYFVSTDEPLTPAERLYAAVDYVVCLKFLVDYVRDQEAQLVATGLNTWQVLFKDGSAKNLRIGAEEA